MKLFMEVNPTLFDECSQQYTEATNSMEERKQARDLKWEKLAAMAREKQQQNSQANGANTRVSTSSGASNGGASSGKDIEKSLKGFEKLGIEDSPEDQSESA